MTGQSIGRLVSVGQRYCAAVIQCRHQHVGGEGNITARIEGLAVTASIHGIQLVGHVVVGTTHQAGGIGNGDRVGLIVVAVITRINAVGNGRQTDHCALQAASLAFRTAAATEGFKLNVLNGFDDRVTGDIDGIALVNIRQRYRHTDTGIHAGCKNIRGRVQIQRVQSRVAGLAGKDLDVATGQSRAGHIDGVRGRVTRVRGPTGHATDRRHHHQVAIRNNQAFVIGEDLQVANARVQGRRTDVHLVGRADIGFGH